MNNLPLQNPSLQLASLALEAAQLGAWEISLSGRATWDQRTRELHNADPFSPIDIEAARNYVHPDDRPALDRIVAESSVPGGRGYYQAEYRLNATGTTQRWMRVFARVILQDGVMTGFRGVVQDITAQKDNENLRNLLSSELTHRTKNMVGIIQSIARRTFSHPDVPRGLLITFMKRLHALARSHEILAMAENALEADVHEIVSAAITPFREAGDLSVVCKGPEAKLDAEGAVAVSLILHELLTNAIKYGALSTTTGTVSLIWEVTSEDLPVLIMRWVESGGPLVQKPCTNGFGTTLINGILNYRHDTATKAELAFDTNGVVCTLHLALPQ